MKVFWQEKTALSMFQIVFPSKLGRQRSFEALDLCVRALSIDRNW